jgi:hypothetical protein
MAKHFGMDATMPGIVRCNFLIIRLHFLALRIGIIAPRGGTSDFVLINTADSARGTQCEEPSQPFSTALRA